MKNILIFLSVCVMSAMAENLNVTVSLLPQKYFVEQIAKDKVNVNVMVKQGFSPAIYEPQSSQMKLLTKSDAYFSIGVPFESAWLEKFKNSNKSMMLVDTTRGIQKIPMLAHGDHDKHDDNDKHDKHDEHEEHEEHEHEDGLDPHVWLDPILVKIQAKNIYEALVKLDAKNRDFYFDNYKFFLNDLTLLDNKIKKILLPIKKSAFMVFHPSWGYFAARYDLEQIVVEKEGKTPKFRELVELIEKSKERKIKIVFVAPQFSQKAASTIAKSISGDTFVINPLSYSYQSNLINTAKAIYNSYK